MRPLLEQFAQAAGLEPNVYLNKPDDELLAAIAVKLAARTPAPIQDDLTAAGQRRINLIWERTQAALAVLVVVGYITMLVWSLVNGKIVPSEMALLTGNIVGFYFSRTNHVKIGGVGANALDTQAFHGR